MPSRSWQRPPSASIPYCERVVRDRRHRAQVGERRPEPVVGRDVRPVKLLRPRCPEALARVVEVPGVEVRHLGTLDGDDPAELAGADGPRAPRPDRAPRSGRRGSASRSRGRAGRRRRGPPPGARSGSRGDRSRVATSSASASECAGATLARAPEVSPSARAVRRREPGLRRSASRRGPPGRRGGCGAEDRAGRGSRRRSEARAPPARASGRERRGIKGSRSVQGPVPSRQPRPFAVGRPHAKVGPAAGAAERGRAPASRACGGGPAGSAPRIPIPRPTRGAREGRHRTCPGARGSRPRERDGQRAAPAHDRMRGPGGQMEQRAGLEVEGAPSWSRAAPGGRVLEFLRGASRHSRADGHGPPPLELEPERVDVPVVVEAHARPSRSLDEEQERALLASAPRERSEEGAPEADHEPHQARQDLVHLREIGRLPGRQGGREASRVARPVHAALRGDLEWEPAAGHLDARGEAGGDGAPCPVARPEGRSARGPGLAGGTGQRAVAGKPARERGSPSRAEARAGRESRGSAPWIGPSCRTIGERRAANNGHRGDRGSAADPGPSTGQSTANRRDGRGAAVAVERKRLSVPASRRRSVTHHPAEVA